MDKSVINDFKNDNQNEASVTPNDSICLTVLNNHQINDTNLNEEEEVENHNEFEYQNFEEEEEEFSFEPNIPVNTYDEEESYVFTTNYTLFNNEEEENNNNNRSVAPNSKSNILFSKNEEEEEPNFNLASQIHVNNNSNNISMEEEESIINKISIDDNKLFDKGDEVPKTSDDERNFELINNKNFVIGVEEEEFNNQYYFSEKEEEEEEEFGVNLEIQSTSNFHRPTEEEDEEEDSFVFESTQSDNKPNYLDDDHVDLITDNDEDTKKLFKKLENMELDLSKIENQSDDIQIEEEEEEEGEQNQFAEEEEKKEDVFSISNYDITMDKDTKELLNVINSLQIEKQSEKEKPLQVFDPAIVNEELNTKDHLADKQFDFQDSFVYRDIEADMKPYKQRGNKRNVYQDLHSFDCAALVIDPSKPEKEIHNYETPNFNHYDEAAIITARTKDAPIPDYEILTPYPGEIESLILQAYLDFNDL